MKNRGQDIYTKNKKLKKEEGDPKKEENTKEIKIGRKKKTVREERRESRVSGHIIKIL